MALLSLSKDGELLLRLRGLAGEEGRCACRGILPAATGKLQTKNLVIEAGQRRWIWCVDSGVAYA